MPTDTLDPLSLPHARGLLAALDAGDDGALLPLADMLEECGDPRAAGLRRHLAGPTCRAVPARVLLVPGKVMRWGWQHGYSTRHAVGADPWESLVRAGGADYRWGDWLVYPSRSAALLALAEALADAS